MLTIDPEMVSRFGACTPISFRQMFFGCLFLDPHLTSYPSHKGVQSIAMLHLDMSTLGGGGHVCLVMMRLRQMIVLP